MPKTDKTTNIHTHGRLGILNYGITSKLAPEPPSTLKCEPLCQFIIVINLPRRFSQKIVNAAVDLRPPLRMINYFARLPWITSLSIML